jgi:hypothetical protein
MILAIKSVLTSQVDFTGEFPVSNKTVALWRFNETAPDSNNMIADASGFNRDFYVSAWSGTSASFPASRLGRFFRQNIINPTSEKTHLIATNDGGFFTDLGEKIVVGGWINPTTYSIGQTFIPIFNTRQGPGQPIFYVSLYQGRPRLMLYNASGTLIYDQSETPPITLKNNGWYFFASIIEVNNKQVQNLLCDRSDGAVWQSPIRSFTGELNKSCTADIVMGMHANTYYYAGGFDDWFYEKDSDLNMDDLIFYFKSSLLANGGDSSSDVDAIKEAGAVLLKETDGSYPSSGILYTTAALCNLSGTGRVSVTSEYTAGITSISLVETSTSDDLDSWTAWQTIGSSGELQSPNKAYIRYRITLTTQDSSKTPRFLEIQLHDIPRPPYEKLGFARPVVLNSDGAWESVLDNAFDILVTSEVNGADILEFKLPFHDPKRETLDNEKQVQIVNDVYRIRTIKDEKSSDGKVVTIVYAEAILSIVNHMSETIKVDKMAKFFYEMARITLGFFLTLFVGIMTLRALYASVLDKVALRTTRYLSDNAIPVIGKMFSDTIEVAAGYVVMLKQALSIFGVLIILGLILMPLIKIAAIALIYKAASAIAEPLGDSRTASILESMSTHLFFMLAAVIAVALMFFIMIAIVAGMYNGWAMLK